MILQDSAQRSVYTPPAYHVRTSALDVRGRDAWHSIDRELAEWLKDSSQIVEPGGEPPSLRILRAARTLMKELQADSTWTAPQMVVPDNCGGLAFEFHSGSVFKMLSIPSTREANLSVFQDGRFISSTPVKLVI